MKEKIFKKQLREFGIIISLFSPIFIGFLIPFISGHPFKYWTLLITLIFGLITIFEPRILLWPYKIWMKLGYILGWINSRLILGLVFMLVLQPIAFTMRIFGHDPLRKKINKKKLSYREFRKDNKIDLNRIF